MSLIRPYDHTVAPTTSSAMHPAPRRQRQPYRRARSASLLSLALVACTLTFTLASCGQSPSDSSGPIQIASNITAFPLLNTTDPSLPGAVVADSAGNLWLTLQATGKVGRVTPEGVFTQHTLPAPDPLFGGMIVGPDGNIWLTDMHAGTIWQLNPATDAVRGFPIPGDHSRGSGITTGSAAAAFGNDYRGMAIDQDGAIWFSDPDTSKIGRLDPATGTIQELSLPAGDSPSDMTVGSDGAIWVSLANAQAFVPGGNIWIARIDPRTHAMRLFSIPHTDIFVNPPGSDPPQSLTPGPDGNVWFYISNSNANGQMVGYITPTGVVKEFATQGLPQAITAGPDGNLWFTNYDGTLARITPAGIITSFPVINGGGWQAWSITTGPDHNLWIPYETQDSRDSSQTFIARVSIAPWA